MSKGIYLKEEVGFKTKPITKKDTKKTTSKKKEK